ncbi:MAG: hypothetical protein HZA60_02825 [Deltaproteobacteria bacterium]|nr:hypothetical protein [Deltaproteobacteria bacterium]
MPRNRKQRFDLRRLLAFPLLRATGERESAGPSEGELLFELSGQNPENHLFGRFDAESVRSRLSRAGILPDLARRGYPDPLLVLECEDPADQRILLFAGGPSRERLLLEARLELRRFHPRKAIGPFTEESTFRMLILHWLSLSDPDRPFTVARPRLPGQQRPGLGLLPQILALLRDFGRELGGDGVLDVPDHFHTALFYAVAFRFLEPEKEGRFQAIARDLKGAPLALVSEAIDFGCLCDAATGKPLPWEPAEQVLAVRGPLRRHLLSAEYRRLRDRAFSEVRAAVDWDRYRAKIAEKGRSGNYP